MEEYDNLLAGLQGLKAQGYTEDFNLRTDCLEMHDGSRKIYEDDFEVDKYFRFDDDSAADGQSILYAISCAGEGLKGTLVNAYGTYADDLTEAMERKLRIDNRTTGP